MTAEEMTAMLELEDGAAGEVLGGREGGGTAVGGKSEYALNLDKWAKRRGADLVSESDELKEMASKLGTKAADDYWTKAVSDFHAAAFEPEPALVDACEDELRHKFVKDLMDTPDFSAIRASTVLNSASAEVATHSFAAAFAKRLAEDRAEKDKVPPATSKGKPGESPAMSKAAKKRAAGSDAGFDEEIATMRAAASAVAEAKKAVDEAREASEMCGGIGGNGAAGSGRMDPKRVAELHKRVKKSPRLRRVAEFAGRFRRVAQSKQRMKSVHGADEVIGVTLGDELSRLLPAELATLTDDDFGLDTARRLMEQQTLVRDMKATEPAGRGPIVVTVDESGSMSGTPVETAKALGLAMAWIARKQKRWVCLVSYSGDCKGEYLVMPPGRWDEAKILDWCEHFYGGGSCLDVPVQELPVWWPEFQKLGMPRGKTDIVMITDARANVPKKVAKAFMDFKANEKVRMTTLVIGDDPGDLAALSDDVYRVPAIDADSEAVGSVLGV